MVTFLGAKAGTGSTSVTVDKPAGVAVGDLMVAHIHQQETDNPTAVPSGWTLLGDHDAGSQAQFVYYRIVDGTEGASFTWQWGISRSRHVVIAAWTDVHPTAPITAPGFAMTDQNSASPAAPSVVAEGAGKLVCAWGFWGGITFTAPASMTQRYNAALSTISLLVADETVTPGATGGRSAAASSAGRILTSSVVIRSPNTAPLAPSTTGPSDGTSIDRTVTQRASWIHNDADTDDPQSKYDLRYRVSGTSEWTTVTGTTPNQFHDFAAGTFADATTYEWQVRTYDQAGDVGPYSSLQTFTAIDPPPGPTITSPTSGGTVSAIETAPTWSTPEQDAFQIQRVADDAGVIDTATVYQDSGTQTSSSARSYTLTFDTDGRHEWIRLRVRVDGVWSDWVEIRVEVSYAVPATPTCEVDDEAVDGALVVWADHPTPVDPEPSVASMRIWRREVDDVGDGERIATDQLPTVLYTDAGVVSGVSYAYRVQAIGNNGTWSWSAWTEEPTPSPAVLNGGTPDTVEFDGVLDGGGV